jgi:hypothetical protein
MRKINFITFFKNKFHFFILLYLILFIFLYKGNTPYLFCRKSSYLTVGFDTEVYSLLRQDQYGNYVGIGVDLIKDFLENQLGISCSFKKINFNSQELYDYKFIFNYTREQFQSLFFVFTIPFLEFYDFIVITKKQIIKDYDDAALPWVGLKGDVLYFFKLSGEIYDYVDDLKECFALLQSGRTIILEANRWPQFKYLVPDLGSYDIVKCEKKIKPICIGIFYDKSYMLNMMNKYIKKYRKWKNYGNSI